MTYRTVEVEKVSDIGVAELQLHRANIGARFQRLNRGRMPQEMEIDVRRASARFHAAHPASQPKVGERSAMYGLEKRRIRRRERVWLAIARDCVATQGQIGLPPHRHHAWLLALGAPH